MDEKHLAHRFPRRLALISIGLAILGVQHNGVSVTASPKPVDLELSAQEKPDATPSPIPFATATPTPTLTPSVTPLVTYVPQIENIAPQSQYCLEYLNTSGKDATVHKLDVLGSGSDSPHQLTGVPSFDIATPSPDRRYVLYSTSDDGTSHETLFVQDLVGNRSRFIIDARFASATWSPDGRQLAYLWQNKVEKGYDTFLAISDADGSNERILHVQLPIAQYEPAYISQWAPDEKYITVGFGYYNSPILHVFRSSDFDDMGLEMGSPIAWRPDGKQIAFWSDSKIVITTPDGNYIQSFFSGISERPSYLSWSPNQKYLLAVHTDEADVLNLSTGKKTSLPFSAILSNWWSVDGNAWIYFEDDPHPDVNYAGPMARLMRFDVTTQSSTEVVAHVSVPGPEVYANPLEVSADGRIALAVPKGFMLIDNNGGHPVFVENRFRQVVWGAEYFSWSPDSKYFVAAEDHSIFWTDQDGNKEQVNVTNGEVRFLSNGIYPYVPWNQETVWLGKHQLPYVVLTEHTYELYVLDLETGISSRITDTLSITSQIFDAYPWVLSLSPDQHYGILTHGDAATNDSIEPVWIDFVEQRPLPHDLRAFPRALYGRWSPDYRFFASLGQDQLTRDFTAFHTTIYIFDALQQDIRAIDIGVLDSQGLTAIQLTLDWKSCD